MYRYQEFKDQLHNFNDHVLISLNLCLFLRSSLQVVIGRLATIVDLICYTLIFYLRSFRPILQ